MGFSFFQSPQQKLDYVKSRQNLGEKVLMIGDGLNDAGALRQSDVGIAVVNHYSAFAPACDVILNTKHVSQLEVFLQTCKNSKRLIYISFIYSLIYNSIGIYFGVTGTLQPVIAAILMPLSSIGVIFISYIGSHLISKPLVNS
ncbi:MAG: HAD-IC family P-type ATPase [Saprospiraceae bacterium]|nr:HAD-IC family P-type ATPase [Saprospiraceae bacterium]